MVLLCFLLAFIVSERSFKIVGDEFQLDGKPFRYISGSFHYFRQHPEYWEDNIKKMAAGGLNCIQTYIAWNIHEPERGHYNWEGFGDLERFINLCQKHNMLLILRPGPFICAEWEFAGFPYWLITAKPGQIRINNPKYLEIVDEWFTVLFAKIKPHLYKNGGNVISIQVENEYGGYYACDHDYVRHLAKVTKDLLGSDVVAFTTDPPQDNILKCGSIYPDAFATTNFQGGAFDVKASFQLQKKYNNGTGPAVSTEYYTGWIDHWREPHNKVSTEDVIKYMDEILAYGASINVYMFYGGTNFAYFSGANGALTYYSPDPTSYDYDAPLSEAGDMTWKYQKMKELISKYRDDIPVYDDIKNTTKKSFGNVKFTKGIAFYDALDMVTKKNVESDDPLPFEFIPTDYGFVLYSTEVEKSGGKLKCSQIHDRAHIYLNGKRISTQFRNEEVIVELPSAGKVDILIENFGRINTGQSFMDSKGLTGSVQLDGKALKKWTNRAVPFTSLEGLVFPSSNGDGVSQLPKGCSAFYKGEFTVEDETADTYINPTGWKHGIIYVNGFNIGRYWTVGPQLTLYVPAPVLKKGVNEVVVFEVDGVDEVVDMTMDDHPQIDIIKKQRPTI